MTWSLASWSLQSSLKLRETCIKKKCKKIRWPTISFYNKGNEKVIVLVSQSCWTLCNTMDCSLSGSCAHGILQASILEWVAIPFSRGSFRHRDRTWVSCITGKFIAGRVFVWATMEAHSKGNKWFKNSRVEMNQCGLFSQEKVLEQDSYDWLLYKQIMVLTEGKHLRQRHWSTKYRARLAQITFEESLT